MCRLKSGIVLKNRVFVPDYDSHEEMLKELGIEDNAINAMKTFVRVELSPVGGDVFSDIDSWKLSVDQDILPDWWDEEEYKPRITEAVKEWASEHIHDDVKDLKLSDGLHYVRNSEVESYNNSVVYAYGNSTVVAYCNSKVEVFNKSAVKSYGNSKVISYDCSTITAFDNSSAVAYNNSKVVAFDNSTITARNRSRIKSYDNSTVRSCAGSIVEARDRSVVFGHFSPDCLNVTLFDNATCKDIHHNKIYQAGNWEIIKV